MPQFASSAKAVASHHALTGNNPHRIANSPERDGESPFAALLDSAAPTQDQPLPKMKSHDAAPRNDQPDRAQQPAKSADAKADKPDKCDTKDAAASDDTANPTDAANAPDSADPTAQTKDAKDGEDAKAAEALAAALDGQSPDAGTPVAQTTTPDIGNANAANTAQTAQITIDATAAAIPTIADTGATVSLDPLKAEIDVSAGPKAKFAAPLAATQLVKVDTDTNDANAGEANLAPEKAVDPKQAASAEDLKKLNAAAKHADDDATPVHKPAHPDLPAQALDPRGEGATKVSGDPVQIALPAQAANSTPQSNSTQASAAQQLQQPAAVPIQGLGVELAGKALAGKNRFEIRLDPPELGRIEVRLDVDKQGQVTSRLIVDRPDTLDLLRRDAPSLERALQDAGLKTDSNSLQFSLRDQPMYRDTNQDQSANAAQLVIPDDSLPIEATQRGYGRLAGLGGGLDIRV